MSPTRRHFLAASGATLLTLQAGMVRSQPLVGPLAPAPLAPPPLAPWAVSGATAADPRLAAMAWAVLAPNPHNRQPWALRLVGENDALLLCDLDRRLPETDPFDRQIVIGLGCFLELFRMAAAERGLNAALTPFPEGEPTPRLDARPIAHITLRPGGAKDPLFAAVPRRRSAKQPYDLTRPLPEGTRARLASALLEPGRLGVASGDVAAIRDLTWRAWLIEANTPAAWGESVELTRLGSAAVAAQPDGISLWGPQFDAMLARGELSHAAMRAGQPGHAFALRQYEAMLSATNAYAWLTTPGNSRAEQLAAGRDWLRLNLAATVAGLAMQPVSQALQEFPEMAGPYAEAPRLLNATGTVQMLGRLGFATRPAPPTPRWPAESRILAG
ncbi:MAG TPA: hypothetical protein VGN96_18535 [Roseococcus sp.]|jgi:hypothetical protein|nr:hypothetical protein [Roseococcus sp.]